MNKHQRQLRQTASEEFLQSYETQLLNAFQEPQPEPEQSQTPESDPSISLSELEAAIADIDNYLQTQKPNSSE